jgi:hypothetical protein
MRAPLSSSRPGWRPGRLRRLARNPIAYWAVALAAASWCAVLVAAAVPTPPPDPQTVWITDRDVAAGSPLTTALRQVQAPGALVPARVLVALADDARSARSIGAHEIVTLDDVAGASTLAPGEAAVAVPTGPTTPPTTVGAPVVLVLHPDPFGMSAPRPATMVSGRVLATADDQMLVAVARTDLIAVTAALQFGSASVALGD